MSSAAVVVVTFEPDLALLAINLTRLKAAAGPVVVFDNSDPGSVAEAVRAVCRAAGVGYLGGAGNVGVATAQNTAVKWLESAPVDRVVFLDQDSKVADDLIPRLQQSYGDLKRVDPQAGVLGALPIREDGTAYPVPVLGRQGRFLRVDFAISSGSIVGLTELRGAGGFRDDLFIDLVDNELCWRMQRAGRASYVDPTVQLLHQVGTGRMVALAGRRTPVSAPFRNYYQVRNWILVGRAGLVPWRRVLRGVVFRCSAALLSGGAEGRALERLRFLARGIRDGIRGVGGCYDARPTRKSRPSVEGSPRSHQGCFLRRFRVPRAKR